MLRVLYEAVEGNRLLGITGAQLRRDLTCRPAGEGPITVDWEQGNTPAIVTLAHEGIRRMQAVPRWTAVLQVLRQDHTPVAARTDRHLEVGAAPGRFWAGDRTHLKAIAWKYGFWP
ncbi:hypothetical protein ACIPUC_14110 [Streptomyces sp. LARHCF249]